MEGPAKQPDSPNIVAIIAIGAVGALLVYVSFISLQAFYMAQASRLESARDAEGKSYEVRTLHSSQAQEIGGYRWVNQNRKIVTLPIEVAMEKVVAEVRNGNPDNLVPAVGPHHTPTVPAVYGRPPDNVQMNAPTDQQEGQEDAAATEGSDTGEVPEGAEDAAATEEAEAAEGAAAGEEEAAAAEGAGDSAAPAAGTAAPSAGEQTGAPAGGNAPGNTNTGAGAAAQPASPAANPGGNGTP